MLNDRWVDRCLFQGVRQFLQNFGRRSCTETCRTSTGTLQVMQCCEGYSVNGAGIPKVNGCYIANAENRDGVLSYSNDAGVVLFRYRFPNGASYWYFSDCIGDVHSSVGDYYRCKSILQSPPPTGWTNSNCAAGSLLSLPNSTERNCPAGLLSRLPSPTEPFECASTLAVQIEIMLLSGSCLASLLVNTSWTGAQVKLAITRSAGKYLRVSGLMAGTQIFQDSQTVEDLGLTDGSVLHASIGPWDYYIESGVPAVNGHYVKQEDNYNGACSYTNASNVMLFRYPFPNGKHYWYLSESTTNLSKSVGDYFRVKSEDLRPPLEGWVVNTCPLGVLPSPILVKAAEVDHEG